MNNHANPGNVPIAPPAGNRELMHKKPIPFWAICDLSMAKGMDFIMKNIVEIVERKVIDQCNKYQEKTGADDWRHIESVLFYANQLAEKYGADKEIVALGALLHDVSFVFEYGDDENHHVYSAEIAEKSLLELDYPQERVEQVKNCVLNHRGSVLKNKNSVEEECVADADALAHYDSIVYMLESGWTSANLKSKLERDYVKLSGRTRELIKDKYYVLMSVLFSDRELLH